MKIYWYAPQLRPPEWGGMPRIPEALRIKSMKFPGEMFEAWAYENELPSDVVEHFDLKLVKVED